MAAAAKTKAHLLDHEARFSEAPECAIGKLFSSIVRSKAKHGNAERVVRVLSYVLLGCALLADAIGRQFTAAV